MTTSIESSRVSAIKVALAVIPALLIISICVALYLGANADQEESEPLKGEVTVKEMADYLQKLNVVIGPRDIESNEGRRAFRQVNAMTIGTLGPQNLGYEIFKSQTDSAQGLLWTTIWINAGDRDSDSPFVIAIPLAESGVGPAFGYGFAEYLTSHETKAGVRIVFYPPLASSDLESWIWERVGKKGETMSGFLKITGDGPVRQLVGLSSPGQSLMKLRGLILENKLGHSVLLANELSSYLEFRLSEANQSARAIKAQGLIRLMPLMKDVVENMSE